MKQRRSALKGIIYTQRHHYIWQVWQTIYLVWQDYRMCRWCFLGFYFSKGNPIVEIRWSYDHLTATIRFHMLVKQHLYVESSPAAEMEIIFWMNSVNTVMSKSFGGWQFFLFHYQCWVIKLQQNNAQKIFMEYTINHICSMSRSLWGGLQFGENVLHRITFVAFYSISDRTCQKIPRGNMSLI